MSEGSGWQSGKEEHFLEKGTRISLRYVKPEDESGPSQQVDIEGEYLGISFNVWGYPSICIKLDDATIPPISLWQVERLQPVDDQ